MDELSNQERLILAVLEEAGEEHLPALVNTLEKRLLGNSPGRTQAISVALGHLITHDLVRVARFRDKIHHRLVPLSVPDSLSIVTNLESLLERSRTDQLWRWKSGEPIVDVILTDSGMAAARKILSADGWPNELT
jgi:hypothetical protein